VPAIAIDPKGDLGNLLLAFPNLAASDFRPWIEEGEAARKGVSPDEFAAQQAELWRSGLAKWDQGPERDRRKSPSDRRPPSAVSRLTRRSNSAAPSKRNSGWKESTRRS
jgi:hypothetical protein